MGGQSRVLPAGPGCPILLCCYCVVQPPTARRDAHRRYTLHRGRLHYQLRPDGGQEDDRGERVQAGGEPGDARGHQQGDQEAPCILRPDRRPEARAARPGPRARVRAGAAQADGDGELQKRGVRRPADPPPARHRQRPPRAGQRRCHPRRPASARHGPDGRPALRAELLCEPRVPWRRGAAAIAARGPELLGCALALAPPSEPPRLACRRRRMHGGGGAALSLARALPLLPVAQF